VLFNRQKGLVSIVITCYNVASFIEECLDGIFDQSYKNIEVIIIDDFSNDPTKKKIKKWIKKNNPSFPIDLITLPRNVGFAGAINIGYILSKGEYIAVHDADDISHKDRIQKQVKFLEEKPEVGLVGTTYAAFQNGNIEEQQIATWIRYGEDIKKTYGKGGHCVCHGTIMFRGEIFDRIGGPTRRIKGAEDYEFIANCINAGIEISNIPEVLYYYRAHPNQRSRQFYSQGEKKDV
jgi:glycosyltransferase involved in cell wall biosynthesis